jgi:hypothetical protein
MQLERQNSQLFYEAHSNLAMRGELAALASHPCSHRLSDVSLSRMPLATAHAAREVLQVWSFDPVSLAHF